MPWVEVFTVFVVCHLAGDYLLQTEFQATSKHGGLGRDPVARRALLLHVLTYTLAYAPALIWLGGEHGAGTVAAIAAAIAIPHLILDDGRPLALWLRRVKHTSSEPGTLTMLVDQSFHIVCLFALALAVGA